MLSEKQKEMRMKMNSVNDLEKCQQLRHERNHILTEIHDLIRVEETNKVDAILSNIEIRRMTLEECFKP